MNRAISSFTWGMRLQPYIKVQDDLFETGGFDFFQGLRDARRSSGFTFCKRSTISTKYL
jgi:hypothetical protein